MGGLCHKLVIAEKPKPKPSLLVVFATSWSLLNMAQKQKKEKKETETEAKPSCGLCHKLVIAEHGTKKKRKPNPKPSLLVVFATSWSLLNMAQKKKGNRNRSQAF